MKRQIRSQAQPVRNVAHWESQQSPGPGQLALCDDSTSKSRLTNQGNVPSERTMRRRFGAFRLVAAASAETRRITT